MGRERFESWISRYERAWRTAGTEALASLFAEGASYRTAPFEPAHEGLEAIAALWEEEREGPDEEFELQAEVIAAEGDVAVARIEVRYVRPGPRTYRDLWVIRLDDDGRCAEFEEWPFWPEGTSGTYRPGPAPNPTEEESPDA